MHNTRAARFCHLQFVDFVLHILLTLNVTTQPPCHFENSIPRGGMRVDRNLQDAERPPMNRAGYGTASDESD
jgi:hypothetical protein